MPKRLILCLLLLEFSLQKTTSSTSFLRSAGSKAWVYRVVRLGTMLSDATETCSLSPVIGFFSLQKTTSSTTFLCSAGSKAWVYRVARLAAMLSDATEICSLSPTSESSLRMLFRVPPFVAEPKAWAKNYFPLCCMVKVQHVE